MAKLISGVGLLGGVLLLCAAMMPGEGVDVPGPSEVAETSRSAVVNFSRLLGEEFEAAASMTAEDAFRHIESRKDPLLKVIMQPVGKEMNAAAYPDGSEEFDSERFLRVMHGLAKGFQSVR